MAVGAPFAVLVAEQLHVSGAEFVVSITSAGQVQPLADPAYFVVLVDRAWRDKGTSAHYQPLAPWSYLPAHLVAAVSDSFDGLGEPVSPAPPDHRRALRETATALAAARAVGCVCVEMEAAAPYAYAAARQRDVICLAHVTNTMAISGDDFAKGDANGVHTALPVVSHPATRLTRVPA